MRTTRAFLPLLQEAARSAIVNVSSSLGSLAINAAPAAHTGIWWAPERAAAAMRAWQVGGRHPRFGVAACQARAQIRATLPE